MTYISRPEALRHWVRTAWCAALLGCVPVAFALPMASEASWMTMADFNSDGDRDIAANYAITGRDAIGAMATRWKEPVHHGGLHKQHLERESLGLTYTRLMHRWNLPHAQANLWFVGAAGRARSDAWAGERSFWSPAVMADFETTRLYLGAGLEPKRGGGDLRHDTAWLRAGFSFYEVDYEQVQPWFIVERKRVRYAGATRHEITPMLRLIHRGIFVEFGRNREGTQVNLMWAY